MRLLFVHHSFPGQFLYLVQALARGGQHEVVFISPPTPTRIDGVRQAFYVVNPASSRTHPHAREFDAAIRRAVAVAEVAAGLRAAGFQPDIIVGHEGWGVTLNLTDVWPTTPQLGYREYFYHLTGADVGCDPEFPVSNLDHPGIRAKNAVGMVALLQHHPGVSPTAWQRSLYPAWSHPLTAIVPDGVNLEECSPSPASRAKPFQIGGATIAPSDRLVTFVARDLEPQRGFHTLVRSLPRLMTRRDVQVVCVGGDGASYGVMPPIGTWRQRLVAEVAGAIDPARLHFPGQVPYTAYRDLLRRSDIHTYLSYPFIVSWSLREALACGCMIVATDTAPVREFVIPGQTGQLIRPQDPEALADAILDLLERPQDRASFETAARVWAENNLSMQSHIDHWAAAIESAAIGGVRQTFSPAPHAPTSG